MYIKNTIAPTVEPMANEPKKSQPIKEELATEKRIIQSIAQIIAPMV